MSFHVDNQDISDDLKSILIRQGAPDRVFRVSYPLGTAVQTIHWRPEGEEARTLSEGRQLKQIKRIVENPFRHDNYIYLIGSKRGDLYPRALALLILKAAVLLHVERSRSEEGVTGTLPKWHHVTGSFKDKMWDKDIEDTLGRPSLLILDGITGSATAQKMENLRDIVRRYESIPIIIVASGVNVLEFVENKLNLDVDGMISVDSPLVDRR